MKPRSSQGRDRPEGVDLRLVDENRPKRRLDTLATFFSSVILKYSDYLYKINMSKLITSKFRNLYEIKVCKLRRSF